MPPTLRIFLASLAIIDDIGAVLIIALFYSTGISWPSLLAGASMLAALIAANRFGVRSPLAYAVLGIALWLFFLQSGVHATVAGVLLAMTIPARSSVDKQEFLGRSRSILLLFETTGRHPNASFVDEHRQAALQELGTLIDEAQSPLQRLSHGLQPWVAYLVVPLFALSNAGLSLGGDVGTILQNPVGLGIMAGLIIGKPLGIISFVWLAVRRRLAVLPRGVSWQHIFALGSLGGIGFTMSLFIADMAFGESLSLSVAKLGILTGSLLAGLMGWFLLRITISQAEIPSADYNE